LHDIANWCSDKHTIKEKHEVTALQITSDYRAMLNARQTGMADWNGARQDTTSRNTMA
jgi:hypothetical protein